MNLLRGETFIWAFNGVYKTPYFFRKNVLFADTPLR
jgi:hypothetical protein